MKKRAIGLAGLTLLGGYCALSWSDGMNTRQRMEALLTPAIRPALFLEYESEEVPRTRAANSGSYFGGEPHLGRGEDWPACENCREAMAFVFQADLREHPGDVSAELRRRDCNLFRLFVCRGCDYWPPFFEFRTYKDLAADLEPRSVLREPTRSPPLRFQRFTIQARSGLSLPDWEGANLWAKEAHDLSVRANSDERSVLFQSCRDALVGAESEDEAWGQIGGYPCWIQGEETPQCHECHRPMRLLFQIGNVEEANLTWMDRLSSIYLFHCGEHFERRELVLQST